jgi:ATP-dependent exoDNAse (exonuclease V) beta subunit
VAFDTASLDLDTRKRRPTRLKVEEAAEIDPAGTAAARERAEWCAWRDGYGARHHRPAAIASPSSAGSDEEAPIVSRSGAGAASTLPPGVTGADVGTVVHEVMEKLDLEAPGDVTETARAVALAKGLPAEIVDEVTPIIEKGLKSDVIIRASAASKVWRELPFCIARDGGTIEGKIDLVFEEADGLVIVDYKTNLFDDDDTSALREHYRAQAEAYGLALSAVSDRPVKEVVLLFMRGPKEEPIPIDADPESVEKGLSALVASAV